MTVETQEALHVRLLSAMQESGATVEDFARAWASMDGKRDKFDACKADPNLDRDEGSYMGYLCDAEELFRRAASYARARSS